MAVSSPLVHRIRGWGARHPRAVDACVATMAAALTLPATVGGQDAAGVLTPGSGVTGAGWLAFVAVHVPLVWRRRAPVVVFWAVLAVAAASTAAGVTGVFQVTASVVAMHAVARNRGPGHLLPAVAGAASGIVLSAAWGGEPARALVTGFSVLAATVFIGKAARFRRDYLAELERERELRSRLAVTAERVRIAREMHDVVAHNLAVMVALADGAACTATAAPERASDAMEKVAAIGREALSEMRRLVGLLRDGDMGDGEAGEPVERAPQPGLADLDRLANQLRAAGVRVTVTREGVPDAWSPGAGLAVYRIVQEALTNTLKHAGTGAAADVRLIFTPSGLDLTVTDDGAGRPVHPAAPAGGGHGITGIIDRAASYGGQVEAGPTPNGGWRVRARLPSTETVAP